MPTKIFPQVAKLPAFAWPGGYPLAYLSEHSGDSDTLCPKCAQEEATQAARLPEIYSGHSLTSFVHWEGEPIQCAECGAEIESAYGVPDDSPEA